MPQSEWENSVIIGFGNGDSSDFFFFFFSVDRLSFRSWPDLGVCLPLAQ